MNLSCMSTLRHLKYESQSARLVKEERKERKLFKYVCQWLPEFDHMLNSFTRIRLYY